ncbi:hypothetical protein E4U41_001231 [Claviceps citrina]|nr:hypothetical protein E4U41_001231 [Claviceps citrina]
MSSSPTASVASRGDSPEPLTPRSKIKALLATVESSDEEGGARTIPARPSFLDGVGKRRAQGSPGSVHDDDSDGLEAVARPRGKLASRMQGAEVTKRGTESPIPAAANARERVKLLLLQRDEAEHEDDQASHGDDEDEALPTGPRRQRHRPAVGVPLDDSQEQHRPVSPGLFVSSPIRPSPSKSIEDGSEDSDNDLPSLKSDRFKMLVERKRKERLAREAAEEVRKAEQLAQQERLASEMELLASDDDGHGAGGITDDEGGRLLTQGARPTRKASKKAIEEMNRETQRLARNMQLAHEAKTKKRIPKSSLFERFNYKPAGHVEPEPRTNSSSRPASPRSDAEMNDAATPPSSPPAPKDDKAAPLETGVPTALAAGSVQKKGRRVRVRLPVMPVNSVNLDSDDELQITTTTKNKLDVLFDSVPSKMTSESHSIQALRALAQVKSPGKERLRKADQSKMTPGELQAHLQFKARQQAKLERERRLEMLRGQGIVVQTAEEREKQEQEVEDLVAKARQEAQKIQETEQLEARRQRKANGEVDPLAWDDSEDEEYQGSATHEPVAGLELSGSEDDEMEDAEEEQPDETAGNVLFDDEADSASSEHEDAHCEAQDDDDGGDGDDDQREEEEEEEEEEDDDEVDVRPAPRHRRARNTTTVVSDDEGGVGVTPRPMKRATQMTPAGASTSNASPGAPNSVLRSAKKTFIPGLPVQGAAGLGLTQIFAGTMDSQTSHLAGHCRSPSQSMMPDFDHFPDSNFSATAHDDEPMAEDTVLDSQPSPPPQDMLAATATQGVRLNLSQSQMHGLGSLMGHGMMAMMQTQISEGMEPSQDVGLQQHTPLRERFIERPPPSTVETLMAGTSQQDGQQHTTATPDSPLVRKGRLRRKMDVSVASGATGETNVRPSTPKEDDASSNAPPPPPPPPFQEAAAKKKKEKTRTKPHTAADAFDRRKSRAKAMVEEQAEESEDEYAGLGGVDGEDDSDNESRGSVEEMIDDGGANDGDEGKLAAFYA